MKYKSLVKYNRSCLLLLILLLLGQFLWQTPARASTVRISAEFTPNRNNPNNRTFTNTTPLGGVCGNAHYEWCKANNVFSISTGIGTDSTKLGNGVTDHGRGSMFFELPAQRTITVTSDAGDTADLNLRINGIAFRYNQRNNGSLPSDTRELRGCREAFGNSNSSTTIMRIIMRNDNGAGGRSSCAYGMLADAEFGIPSFDLIYELDTPEPLNMKNGIYRGSTYYTQGGQGSDFDLGDGVVHVVDPNINVHFVLTVNHLFSLDFPPGSETVNLQPLGGWNQWTDYKKVPTTLRKDLHFQISGSTNFSVNLNCEHLMPDGRCGISNGVSTVPLDVAITMPGLLGRNDGSFMEALDYPLTQSFTHVPRFSPKEGAVFQRRSYLRFEVNGEPIKEMVTHPDTHYKGRVTAVFDADI